ncbi:MAG: hypothetical protein PHG06_02725 [Parabacteroides sp.]|nr:hypothetical protein [Parabacteroides sp.]
MKKILLAVSCTVLLLTSCNDETETITSNVSKKEITYEVSIESPAKVENLIKNSKDSVFNIPVKIKPIQGNNIYTKSVVEEVIPANAVLSHRRGLSFLDIKTLQGSWLSDVWTLSITVSYGYGQWVNGHVGQNTGYATFGTISQKIVQNAIQKKIDENSGQWTFSTAAYYPISNYLGQVFPDCKKWYPFHYSQLKLYYTWIDGNN